MLKLFSLYLHAMGKSHGTVSVYCQNISQYLRWCEETFGERPTQLYRANVLEYISYMRNIKGYSPKTVNHHLSSLRSYNDWLIESGRQTETVVLKNDFMKIQLQYASPSTVTKKDVEAFRQRLLESGSKRDYAIVTLFAYSGIRRSECANLKLDQVDLTAREIRVIGKGDKQRLVYINDKIVYSMREYLKERNSESPYCLFMDCHNQSDFSGRHTIIYGHHMDNGTMFQNLMGYKGQSFYDEHPTARLCTPGNAYTVEFFAGYVAGVDGDAWQVDFASDAEFGEWLEDAKNKFWVLGPHQKMSCIRRRSA